MESHEITGLPLVILAGLWGAFDVVIKVFGVLNAQRNKILELKANVDETKITGLMPDQILLGDWLPLWIGLGVFLIIVCIFFWMLPGFLKTESPDLVRRIRLISYIALALPATGVFGWLYGGILEILQFVK